MGTARYEHYDENPIKQVSQAPLATFSLDVDTGSYANVRRFLNQGQLPPPEARAGRRDAQLLSRPSARCG